MQKIDTYLVCNSSLVQKLKNIQQFKLNLGQALINNNNQFMPNDVKVQKHFIYFKQILNLVGYIGTLSIYTQSQCKHNTIMLCNHQESFEYALDTNLSIYDNVNIAIDLFFTKIGLNQDITTVVDEPLEIKEVEYIKPNKTFSEMSDDERIMYARSLK